MSGCTKWLFMCHQVLFHHRSCWYKIKTSQFICCQNACTELQFLNISGSFILPSEITSAFLTLIKVSQHKNIHSHLAGRRSSCDLDNILYKSMNFVSSSFFLATHPRSTRSSCWWFKKQWRKFWCGCCLHWSSWSPFLSKAKMSYISHIW